MPYACRMDLDWNLRELRFFVSAVETGSFTDAAGELGVSQAAVSRTIAALERRLGEQLLRRIPRGCEPTATGRQLVPHVRRFLADAQRLTDVVLSRHGVLRLGYAWSALGRHTTALQRAWAAAHERQELHLIRHNSATSGLTEGFSDVAIVRRAVEDQRIDAMVVGLEQRYVAFASDDPAWSRRRRLTMAEVAERTIVVDRRTGTTNEALWAGSGRPLSTVESFDVDDWLDAIASGRAVGSTSEATAHHHPRPGVTYRPIKDGPRIPVRLAWRRDEPPTGLTELIDTVTRLYAEADTGRASGSVRR